MVKIFPQAAAAVWSVPVQCCWAAATQKLRGNLVVTKGNYLDSFCELCC